MKRVAAYCRVSTDKDDQANSLASQKAYFERYINNNEHWELVEIYVDEGITGTSTKKRKAFNKMVSDAELGLFDMIMTKEISRFARNTLDSIFYTRKLKDLGVAVFFLNDNINTFDPDSELRLTIMSSIAQEESRKTSERVKWGQKRQMEKGVVFGRNIMGYHLENGQLTINEKEAGLIREIFHMYINEKMGTHAIAKTLQDRGIPTKNGGKSWSNAAIFKILKNEKYCGDLIQKKTFTPSYLTHDKKYNKGEEEFVIIENHHEPIISKEIFLKAQQEIEKRRTFTIDKGKHSNRYVFSGKLKCGNCGSNFVSRIRNRKDGTVRKLWQCYEKTKNGLPHENTQGDTVGCHVKEISDDLLQEVLVRLLHDVVKDKDNVLNSIEKAVIAALSKSKEQREDITTLLSEIEQLTAKKHKSVDLYFEGVLSKEDLKSMTEKYDKQLEYLQSKVTVMERQQEITSSQDMVISKIKDTVSQVLNTNYFSEEVCKQVLEKVVVHSKTEFDIYLRSGFNDIMGYFCKIPADPSKSLEITGKKGVIFFRQTYPISITNYLHRLILLSPLALP